MFEEVKKTQTWRTSVKEIGEQRFRRSWMLVTKVLNCRKHMLLYRKRKSKHIAQTALCYHSMVTNPKGQLMSAMYCTVIILGGCLYAFNPVMSKELYVLQKSVSTTIFV